MKTEPIFKRLPKRDLAPDGTNDREFSGFDDKSMKELRDSIIAQRERGGVLTPLFVYPNPDKNGKGPEYLICAGERRYTAAEELDWLKELPCLIFKDATDASVAKEIQITENLQRKQLHGLEEARGLKQLNASKTVDEIAKMVGMSPAYVYGRIKLLAAPAEIQDAACKGLLNDSVLLLLSRIPDPKLAVKAMQEVLDPFNQGLGCETRQPKSFRAAKEHIQKNYMIRLKAAPFDPEDEALVPATWRITQSVPSDPSVPSQTLEVQCTAPPVLDCGTGTAAKDGANGTHPGEWFVFADDSNLCKKLPRKKNPGSGGERVPELFGPATEKDCKAVAALLSNLKSEISNCRVERLSGGACSDCPFRTGNLKKLCPDLAKADGPEGGSPDVCTNPTCYQAKRAAAQQKLADKEKAKGNEFLKEGKAKKLFSPHSGELYSSSGYVDVKALIPNDRKERTWEEALKDKLPENGYVVALNPVTNKRHMLLPVATALAAAESAKVKVDPEDVTARDTPDYLAQQREADEKRTENRAAKEAALKELSAELLKRAVKVKPREALLFALGPDLEQTYGAFDFQNSAEFEKKGTEDQFRTALVLSRHRATVDWNGNWSDEFKSLCLFLDVDLKPFEKRGKELLAERRKEQAAKEKEFLALPIEKFSRYSKADGEGEVEGRRLALGTAEMKWAEAYSFYIYEHTDEKKWWVCELTTGMGLASGDTWSEATLQAHAILLNAGESKLKAEIARATKEKSKSQTPNSK